MAGPRVALVTGGSRGIGRAICQQLGECGYFVAVNYARSSAAAGEVVAEIRSGGQEALAVQADVGDSEQRTALLETVLKQWGRIDLLVNNAGITSPGRKDLLEVTEETWDQVFDTNLKGPFFLSQAAAGQMITQGAGGKIINISSISAYAVSTNRVDYCLTKAALEMMTKLLAVRLADHHIQVFEICPGIIASDMTSGVQEKYDKLIAEGLTPMRRWGQGSDIAKAVAAIAEDYLPFSTGERINVDGGFHIRTL